MRGNAGEGSGLSGLAGLDDARHAVGVALDLFFRKNEASIGWIPFDSFAFMEFEDDGGVFQFALFALAALGLEGAELVERLLELAGQALAMDAERGDGLDQELGSGGVLEEAGFEERDAVLAPREVGELVDKLGFGWRGRMVFVEELLNVAIEGGRVFGRKDRILGGEAMFDRVELRPLFTGFGARAGGALGVRAIDGGAMSRGCCRS